MGLRDIVNKINPFRIVENIKQARQQKKLLKLCETNPEGVFDIINSGFGNGRSLEDVLNAIVNLPNNEIEAILNPLLSKCNFNDTKRIIKYANKKGLNLDVDKITVTRDINGKPDKEIEEYLYSRGRIDAYEFCKLFKPDKNNIEQFVEKDLRCIEFDIANNPKVYEYVINSLIKKIKDERSKANEDYAKEYDKMISYLDKAKEVIFYKRIKNDGKYYFPESEMYKNIRNFVGRYKKTHSKENINLDDLDTLNKPFKAFYERDGFFDEEFGREIQEVYFDDASVLGVHNTGEDIRKNSKDDNHFLKKFFDNGLISLANSKTVTDNVALQDELDSWPEHSLAELLYWVYDMNGKYNLFFKFPKNLLYSKDEKGRSRVIEDGISGPHIPPKYILGAYDRDNPNAELIQNPNFGDEHVVEKEGLTQ